MLQRKSFSFTRVKNIRHLFIGYILVYITPILSVLLHFGPFQWVSGEKDYLIPIMVHAGVNIVIMTVLVVSMALYIFGYKKRQMKSEEAEIILALSPVLILWGAIVTLMAVGFFGELADWSKLPEVRALTIWDYMEYYTWALKGVLWVISGLFLIATSFRERVRLRKTF